MARKPRQNETVKIDEVGTENVPVSTEASEQTLAESDRLPQADLPQEEKMGCGHALRAAREAQGLTTQDAADRLRLGIKQIQALEEDNFSLLPEATIVKGFIRNYAKLLNMPSEPLVAAFIEMRPEQKQHAIELNPGINMKISGREKSDKGSYVVIILVLLLAVGAWLFYQNYMQRPSPVKPMPAQAVSEPALPEAEHAQGAQIALQMPEVDSRAMIESNTSDNTDNTAPVAGAESDVEDPGAEVVAAEENSSEPAAAEEAVAEETSSTPALGKTRIAFTATQETWLSVVNSKGEEIYNKILYAGSRDTVDVTQPAEIVVGNAQGTTLMVDGKLIDLAPYTRINVARVHLDQ